MTFLVLHPALAFAIGGVWCMGLTWILYGFWERLAGARRYNIRVDLFLIYPLLVGLSMWALMRLSDRPM